MTAPPALRSSSRRRGRDDLIAVPRCIRRSAQAGVPPWQGGRMKKDVRSAHAGNNRSDQSRKPSGSFDATVVPALRSLDPGGVVVSGSSPFAAGRSAGLSRRRARLVARRASAQGAPRPNHDGPKGCGRRPSRRTLTRNTPATPPRRPESASGRVIDRGDPCCSVGFGPATLVPQATAQGSCPSVHALPPDADRDYDGECFGPCDVRVAVTRGHEVDPQSESGRLCRNT